MYVNIYKQEDSVSNITKKLMHSILMIQYEIV